MELGMGKTPEIAVVCQRGMHSLPVRLDLGVLRNGIVRLILNGGSNA